jgi:hypothetical protein
MFEENKITVKNQKKMKAIFYRVEFKVAAPVFHDKIISKKIVTLLLLYDVIMLFKCTAMQN